MEDVLDTFWEHPFAFALLVHFRCTEQMTDMFAGRIYGHERQLSPALFEIRQMLKREGERERSYEQEYQPSCYE